MFEKEFSKRATRNIEYTEKQMESMQLRTVYSACSVPEFMDDNFINHFYLGNIRNGEYGLVEMISKPNNTNILSLFVFEDIWSRNLYGLKHCSVYEKSAQLLMLLN